MSSELTLLEVVFCRVVPTQPPIVMLLSPLDLSDKINTSPEQFSVKMEIDNDLLVHFKGSN